MPIRGVSGIVLVTIFSSALAFGCRCSNGEPIQRTSERYRERAVFTAHIVQLMGRTYNQDGKRYSGKALAIIHERYWGLPWFWPKIVLLDGGGLCDIVLPDSEEYLVSGRPERYGVVDVSLCSRSQPLKTAQLDLRTIDGSTCAGPGGTVIGHSLEWSEAQHKNLPAPNVSLTFRSQHGNAYVVQSDGDGIYELQHLPMGPYMLESRLGQHQYASSSTVAVAVGHCTEMPVNVRDYSFSGSLAPGLDRDVKVSLLGTDATSIEIPSDSLETDGRFYFRNVPDGEYLLSATTSIDGAASWFYPGTDDRKKAARIRVSNHVFAGSLDFNPDLLPLVPIPVAIDPQDDSGRFSWRVQLIRSNNNMNETSWIAGEQVVRPYGKRGAPYEIGLYGYSNRPTEYGNCSSERTPVTAKSGMSTVHIAIPAACR
jgi:hypothetical protein